MASQTPFQAGAALTPTLSPGTMSGPGSKDSACRLGWRAHWRRRLTMAERGVIIQRGVELTLFSTSTVGLQ